MAMSGSRRSCAAMSAKRSSSACERRSSASSRLRAVMSCTTAEAPITSPLRSRSGEAVSTTSSSPPSLRTHWVSMRSTRSPESTRVKRAVWLSKSSSRTSVRTSWPTISSRS
jgi:hypothetical protein